MVLEYFFGQYKREEFIINMSLEYLAAYINEIILYNQWKKLLHIYLILNLLLLSTF